MDLSTIHQIVLESMREVVYIRDLDRNILYINPASERLTGWSLDEARTRKCYEVFGDEQGRCREICLAENAIAEGVPALHHEASVKTRSGEIHKMQVSTSPIHGAAGVFGAVVVMEDITRLREFQEAGAEAVFALEREIERRKRAEEKLRESEQRFRSLSAASSEAVVIHEGGVLLTANDQYYEMFGYKPEELVEKKIFPLTVAPEAREFIEKMVCTGVVEPYESIGLKKDGTRFPIEVRARAVEYEGRKARVAAIINITRRKQEEEKLRESEEKFSSAFRLAPMPMAITGMDDGRFIDVNDTFLKNYGFTRSEVLGKTSVELGIWKGEDERSFLVEPIRTKGSVRNAEFTVFTKEGSPRRTLFSGVTIPLQGRPALLTICNDITEQKKVEEALREREHMLRSILVATPVGMCLTENGFIRWANAAWEGMFGFTDESEYVGQPARVMYPSEAHYLAARGAVYSNLGKRIVGETYTDFMRRDGSQFRGRQRSTYLDPSDHGKGTLSAISDLTKIAQSEQARRESEERYRVLFEDSIDAVFVTARDGTFIEANQAFCDLFGYERNELESLTSRQAYAGPADRRLVLEAIKKTGSIKDFTVQFLKKDGTVFEGLLTARVRYRDKAEILGYQGTIRDMTERKVLEKQLLQAQKMEAVGTLAGGVAHDFNNTLTVIQGFSELLLMETDETAASYSDLRKIHDAGLRGAQLVRNLLAFSRKAETKPRPINLNQEVGQIEQLLGRTIPKMIEIDLHLESHLAAVNADPDQIGQVLMNLAVNAKQAMPDGGNLTIATANIYLGKEHGAFYPEMTPGNYVLLTVSDTGHGMDKDTLEHIFEPFFTTKGVGKGTGLGLSIVYGIIRQHGGHITCDSKPGHGTTFKIYLPAITGTETQRGEGPEQLLPHWGTETILLVDDEDSIRDLGQTFLNRAGYTVLTAASGPEALQMYLRDGERILLVILDLIMPEMAGDKCLEEILAVNPNAKILVSSGAADEGKRKETIESGAKGFVSKPFQLREMLATVRAVLDSK